MYSFNLECGFPFIVNEAFYDKEWTLIKLFVVTERNSWLVMIRDLPQNTPDPCMVRSNPIAGFDAHVFFVADN
jgi:hypothetical protein